MADSEEGKKGERQRGAEARSKPTGRTGEDLAAAEAGRLATDEIGKTAEQIRELGAEASSLGPLGVGEVAAESDVTNELSGGGVAFGEFTKAVGLAVAAAQTALDKTLVDTAKALSETEINTVAVFEQQIKDEDGTMDKGVVHIQKLPLTNYLMPTAYQWSRVYLEADMSVQEFNSRSGFNIKQQSFSAGTTISGSAGALGFGVSGSASVNYGQSSTGVDQSFSGDVAAGKLHMEATLEPRSDVQLPRPFILQKGPRMQLVVGAREPIHEGGDATKPVVGQKVTLTAVLQKTNGDKMEADKPLSLSISEPSLNYSASGKTDAQGKMDITLTRTGATYDPTSPLRAMVRVSFGLVSQSVGVAL